MTRLTKIAAAVMVAGLLGLTNNSAQAFWGHRQVVTAGYPVVAAMPVMPAAPIVTGYAPAVATAYAPAVTTSYSLPSVPAMGPVVVSRPVVANYAPAVAPVTSYYAPTTSY